MSSMVKWKQWSNRSEHCVAGEESERGKLMRGGGKGAAVCDWREGRGRVMDVVRSEMVAGKNVWDEA